MLIIVKPVVKYVSKQITNHEESVISVARAFETDIVNFSDCILAARS